MARYSKMKPFTSAALSATVPSSHTVAAGGGYKNKLIIVNDNADGGAGVYVCFGDETALTAANAATTAFYLAPGDKFEEEVAVSVIQVLSASGTGAYHGVFLSE